jgi:hypothetical protein
MKKWFLGIFFTDSDHASGKFVEFLNKHKLQPGEVCILGFECLSRNNEVIKFVYYADHKIELE